MSWLKQGRKDQRVAFFNSVKNINKNEEYKDFRKNPHICQAVSGKNLGNRCTNYFNYLCQNNLSLIVDNKDKLLECDSFGGPNLFDFSNDQYSLSTSDSTIPPVFLIAKCIEVFGEFSKSLDVIEIGCGFGIQTKIFHDIVGYRSYTNVDLPEILELQKRYLGHFNVKNVSFIGGSEEIDKIKSEYDFLISDFAYTELSPELKKIYFDQIIKKCKFGIILGRMNFNGGGRNCIGRKDFQRFKSHFSMIKYEVNDIYGKGGILYFSNVH